MPRRAVASLAAVLCATALAGCAPTPTPAPSATASPASIGPRLTCANIGQGPSATQYVTLPAGATAVRVCPTDTNGVKRQIPAPLKPMTTGVGELVAAVNALPPLPDHPACTAELGLRDTFLIDYPQGTVAISAEDYGCQPIAGRSGAREIRQRFYAAALPPTSSPSAIPTR